MKQRELLKKLSAISLSCTERAILNSVIGNVFYFEWLDTCAPSFNVLDEHSHRINKYNPDFGYAEFLDNLSLAHTERSKRAIFLESSPIYIDLEPYNLCSFKCISCQSAVFKRGNQLTDKTVQEIMEFIPLAEHVEFAKIGEIFMLPARILPIIREIRSLNPCIFMRTNTHGQCLNEDIIKTLVDVEFDLLSVSIDSDTVEGFKQFRNGDLNKVIANMKMLQKYKEGAKFPTILVCSQLNTLSDPLGVCKIAADIGAAGVIFQNMVIYPKNEELYQVSNLQLPKAGEVDKLEKAMQDCHDFCKDHEICLVHPQTPEMSSYELDFLRIRPLLSTQWTDMTCPTGDPWYRFCSNGNGEVSPCCYHSTFMGIKDNATEGSALLQVGVKDMRNHPAMMGLRKMLAQGEYSPNCFCWKKKQFSSEHQNSMDHQELVEKLEHCLENKH